MEEDGFVIISKDVMNEEGDGMSTASSKSSLFLVEDPSTDEVMLNGEKEEEPVPVLQPAPAPMNEISEPIKVLAKPVPNSQESPRVREEVKAVPREQPKFVCSSCSLDVALQADIIWEGYMGANKAAYLFGKVLNTEPAAAPRKQQLSTGVFLLQDIRCRSCSTPFGWSYLRAWNQDQKYKEGSTIIQRSLLDLVEDDDKDGSVQCQ